MDEIEEIPGRLTVRVFSFEYENDEITTWNKSFRYFLVMVRDGIGARGIHDRNFTEDIYGLNDLFKVRVDLYFGSLISID